LFERKGVSNFILVHSCLTINLYIKLQGISL
jgi:hypothetical protein